MTSGRGQVARGWSCDVWEGAGGGAGAEQRQGEGTGGRLEGGQVAGGQSRDRRQAGGGTVTHHRASGHGHFPSSMSQTATRSVSWRMHSL